MNFRSQAVLLIILIPALYSCRSTRHLEKTVPAEQVPASEESYVAKYRDIAVNEMKRTGIPASITLAQGMIESDYGRSTLAREGNNHFGIKCHSDWAGKKIYHHDDHRNECFRSYGKAEDSFYDHSEFLRTGSRYRFLFDLGPSDYKGWAKGLRKAGYATNPDYANMLIRTIEEKGLQYYDSGYKPGSVQEPVTTELVVKPSQPAPQANDSVRNKMLATPVNEKMAVVARPKRVLENNGLRYIIVKDGDTRKGIEEEFQLLGWELSRYNDLASDFRITPGQMLYLQAKRDKAEAGKEFYETSDGDTMYQLAQKFGVRLKSLYKMNGIQEGQEPAPGTRIWLRSEKPLN
jgi:LysM repeat protein